jgi:hypothetical protein
VVLALILACGGYPDDDVLRVNHLQAKGTHNSYHVMTSDILPWRYTRDALDVQLDAGIRQFELDVWWEGGEIAVYHVETFDEGTVCATFADCVRPLAAWSAAHPGHHPALVLVEIKSRFDAATAPDFLAAIDATLAAELGPDRLLVPDDVTGGTANLRDTLAATGWPTLGETRGRTLFVLHAGDPWRSAYLRLGETAGMALFPDGFGDVTLPFSAVHTMNNPYDPHLPDVIAAGHLVRTRADADLAEAAANDGGPRDHALAVGAHFVTTDVPEPVDCTPYFVAIPEGTPSRCNPATAPPRCRPADIERPERLSP